MSSQIKKIKAIIYCRVSTKEQAEEGYSLEAQEKLLTDYAAKYNFEGVKTYKIAETASKDQLRKLFKDVFDYANKNHIDLILCEKIDRLTRNPKDAATVDDWVREKPGRAVHFVKENFVLNQQTKAHENLVWDMKVAIARFYSNNLSEEVKKGQAEKLAQGWLPTKPPFGYKTIGEKGHKIHVLDSKDAKGNLIGNAAHAKWMFEKYATGNYSIARLERELYDKGVRQPSGARLHMSRIHELLQDPFYYGKIRWMGKIYDAKHEPIIDKDVFDKVQKTIRRSVGKPHFLKHNALFKNKIVCEHCGGTMTWYIQKGHWYGHCNNHGTFKHCVGKTCVRQELVEEQLLHCFEGLAPKNDEVLEVIEQKLREQHAEKIGVRENEIRRLNGLLSQVRIQKDKIYEAKINKEVPADYCERRISELTAEEESLESALIQQGDKSDEYQKLGIAVHELAYRSKEIYEKANTDERQLLMSQLFTNLVQNRLEIKPNYSEAAQILVEWVPRLNQDYELRKSQQIKGKADVLTSASPVWLRGWDSNPRPMD